MRLTVSDVLGWIAFFLGALALLLAAYCWTLSTLAVNHHLKTHQKNIDLSFATQAAIGLSRTGVLPLATFAAILVLFVVKWKAADPVTFLLVESLVLCLFVSLGGLLTLALASPFT